MQFYLLPTYTRRAITPLKEVGFDDSVLNDLRKREDDDVATANDIVHWINTYIFSFI